MLGRRRAVLGQHGAEAGKGAAQLHQYIIGVAVVEDFRPGQIQQPAIDLLDGLQVGFVAGKQVVALGQDAPALLQRVGNGFRLVAEPLGEVLPQLGRNFFFTASTSASTWP